MRCVASLSRKCNTGCPNSDVRVHVIDGKEEPKPKAKLTSLDAKLVHPLAGNT